jgi:hypothetical protein
MKKNFPNNTDFYNNQNSSTRAYLDRTPIWYDRDVLLVAIGSALLGFIAGIIIL